MTECSQSRVNRVCGQAAVKEKSPCQVIRSLRQEASLARSVYDFGPFTIRSCRLTDLTHLEWFGLLTEYRQTMTEAFQRFQKGEILLLVAEVNGFPAGQVWVDLTKRGNESIGVLWALRVFLPFQNLGIGTRLIISAEERLRELGFRNSELGVEKDNPSARRLYERLGYRVVRENVEAWEYTLPGRTTVHVTNDEWMMQKFL